MCPKQSLCHQVATLLIRRPGLLVHLLQALFPTPPQSRSRQESSIQIPPTTLRLTRTLFDLADAAACKMQMERLTSRKDRYCRTPYFWTGQPVAGSGTLNLNVAYWRTCVCADQPKERVASEEVPG